MGGVILHKFEIFTTIVRYTGFKENSTKIMERDKALIISCRACLFYEICAWGGLGVGGNYAN